MWKNKSWKNVLQWNKGIVSSVWNVRSNFFVCLFVCLFYLKCLLTCNCHCYTDDGTDGLGQLHTWSPELNKNNETWRTPSIYDIWTYLNISEIWTTRKRKFRIFTYQVPIFEYVIYQFLQIHSKYCDLFRWQSCVLKECLSIFSFT